MVIAARLSDKGVLGEWVRIPDVGSVEEWPAFYIKKVGGTLTPRPELDYNGVRAFHWNDPDNVIFLVAEGKEVPDWQPPHLRPTATAESALPNSESPGV